METHRDVLVGCDFFTAEVLTPLGIFTHCVLFFIKIGSLEVHIAGVTPSPRELWMKQIPRNPTLADIGFLVGCKYVLLDRDSKFCPVFRGMLRSAGLEPIRLPARSPDLNAYSERWVLSVKSECLSKRILLGERRRANALTQYMVHYHEERNHQGLANVIPFPNKDLNEEEGNWGPVQRHDRLGGLPKYYYSEVA